MGLITSAEAVGLIVGGLVSLRWIASRPILFVVLIGAAIAISPLSLAMLLPLSVICVASFGLGIAIEMMSVIWTVTMAAKIPPDMLARVSAYDGLGSMMGMPVGALVAGPIAAAIGVVGDAVRRRGDHAGRLGARADPARRADDAVQPGRRISNDGRG